MLNDRFLREIDGGTWGGRGDTWGCQGGPEVVEGGPEGVKEGPEGVEEGPEGDLRANEMILDEYLMITQWLRNDFQKGLLLWWWLTK